MDVSPTLKSVALPQLKHLLEVAGIVLKNYHTDNAAELSGKDTVKYLERAIHATHSTSELWTGKVKSNRVKDWAEKALVGYLVIIFADVILTILIAIFNFHANFN